MAIARTRPPASSPPEGGNRLFIALIVTMVVLGALAVAVLAGNRSSTTSDPQTAAVELSGQRLTSAPRASLSTSVTADPEIGNPGPSMTGTDFDGRPVSIEPDGRPKAVYFLAHWCPNCQDEVPVIRDLMAKGALPDDVDVYFVSTGVDRTRGNYPPDSWLVGEGIELPIIRDDADSSAFAHFGGSGFPYAIYLDDQHRVAARSSGQVGADAIESIWQTLADRRDG